MDTLSYENFNGLLQSVKGCASLSEKRETLGKLPVVKEFLQGSSLLNGALKIGVFSEEEQVVLKSIIALGQGVVVFDRAHPRGFTARVKKMLDRLVPVEAFYKEMGGVIGYHVMMLSFLTKKEGFGTPLPFSECSPAQGIDISTESDEVQRAIVAGIENVPLMAEIYPVGGAADRLRLHDDKTGLPLPAAKLLFCGKTLLEGMIADVQAREYVYYKCFQQQVTTPLAMMTSHEKENHAQILAICEENRWFGRSKESFRFFCQPLVPTINRQGLWCMQGPLAPLLKPGGHGVLWKLAEDAKIFQWLLDAGRKKALIRQINNPIAAVDYGLFAFSGIGCMQDKVFGFASCPKQLKAQEGINVLLERNHEQHVEYILTNIEYCDLGKHGICDEPESEGSAYSKYPSNTNILFVDLLAAQRVAKEAPIPGMLVNLKKTLYRDYLGRLKEEEIARLESTMQNIADYLGDRFSHLSIPEKKATSLKTYLTQNVRRKTISCAKREFTLGSSLLETPEGCFLDMLSNSRELLVERCGMVVPAVHNPGTFFNEGPSFLFLYHPALGPLYSVICQKVLRGRLAKGAEVQLHLAELDMQDVDVEGSLLIRAENVCGHVSAQGILRYSDKNGKCVLKNVRVRNQGIDRDAPNVFWRGEIFRKESCEIILQGNGEFHAENVSLDGPLTITVEDGYRLRAYMSEGKLQLDRERIKKASWSWKYAVHEGKQLLLRKEA